MSKLIIINFIIFQIGWFACVLGGAHGLPWAGTLTALVLLGIHLALISAPRRELVLLLLAGLLGLAMDSLIVALGITRYPSGMLAANMAPYWIVVMWMQFASTLNFSMRWIKQRLALAPLFGAIGGPLAFYGGHRLGGVSFAEPLWLSLTVIAAVWVIATPLLVACSNRWDGAQPATAAA